MKTKMLYFRWYKPAQAENKKGCHLACDSLFIQYKNHYLRNTFPGQMAWLPSSSSMRNN